MQIRMTRACPAAIDGFSVSALSVGRVYDIKDAVARFLIETGCAEPYDGQPQNGQGGEPLRRDGQRKSVHR
jgi:hypothetical protein